MDQGIYLTMKSVISNSMTSPQKAKGSGFEREIAKYLSEKYSESFIRAPGSGAYVGGKNQVRKEVLHEGQIRSFKGDVVPGQSFKRMNIECKFYADFPFHLLLTGDCKVIDAWIDQLMDVADEHDVNLLFMKFNRKGRYVAVQSKLTWVSDNFVYYTSKKHGDWTIFEFDSFFALNTELLKTYSISTDTTSKSNNILTINT
jgi:Holliday junction resolvase